MKSRSGGKLRLSRETLRKISDGDLRAVVGGGKLGLLRAVAPENVLNTEQFTEKECLVWPPFLVEPPEEK